MKRISVLFKPSSSICNLNCEYCFYKNTSSNRECYSYGFMDINRGKKAIDTLFSICDNNDILNIGFQGGEPTLVGLDFYKDLIKYINQNKGNIIVNYTIQTNGIKIDENWAKIFKENNFLVGLSIDGWEKNHNNYRKKIKDKKKLGTYKQVMEAKNILENESVEYNILSVLTRELSKNPKKYYTFLKDENINYCQLIPCLNDLYSDNHYINGENFYNFYKELFDLWYKDFIYGKYISIKLFDDIINLFLRNQVGFCGQIGECSNQLIIESNGNVYPCDFYCLDEYCLGNIYEDHIRNILNSTTFNYFLKDKKNNYEFCETCKYKLICNGGCKRMYREMYIYNNFCGYKELLDYIYPKMNNIYFTLLEIYKVNKNTELYFNQGL